MSNQRWSGSTSRKILRRIVVEGSLILQTPVHFGSGESDDVSDMPLLVDPRDGKTPLLTGTSIAGALRSYLRSRELGYRQPFPPVSTEDNKAERLHAINRERKSAAVQLFGALRMDDEGEQSPLIIEDCYPSSGLIELRTGVSLDPETRTAREDFLYNAQFWQAGLQFPLRLELLVCKGDDETRLRRALASALSGFQDGEIHLGARKRRGFGRCQVKEWQVIDYDLSNPNGLLGWLKQDRAIQLLGNNIFELLKVGDPIPDSREYFSIDATFKLEGGMLIRSGSSAPYGADAYHLHSSRPGYIDPLPAISGTSLAGAVRSRALRIAKTIGVKQPIVMIDQLFGPLIPKGSSKNLSPAASQLWVEESCIENALPAKDEPNQNRVKIDRFTGGAYPAALFNEQPVFGLNETSVQFHMKLVSPEKTQIGLLLMVLKDLCTGDLPLGGTTGIGRGRLMGKGSILKYKLKDAPLEEWEFHQEKDHLIFNQGDPQRLETMFVQALMEEIDHG